MTRIVCSLSLLLALTATPKFAHADAAGDLAAGQAALQSLDWETALPLLKSASEALPQSVEAQLTLAECQLRLGDLEAALSGYASVVKLSPDHKLATRMVAALTGQDNSYAKQLSLITALMDVGDHSAAGSIAGKAIKLPITESQRLTQQLLQVECTIWSGRANDAFRQALDIIQKGDAKAQGIARVIAAMALAEDKNSKTAVAQNFLKQAGDVAEPWKSRGDFARALFVGQRLESSSRSIRIT
jgi:tetratricopeptide (TPR) repeat protein